MSNKKDILKQINNELNNLEIEDLYEVKNSIDYINAKKKELKRREEEFNNGIHYTYFYERSEAEQIFLAFDKINDWLLEEWLKNGKDNSVKIFHWILKENLGFEEFYNRDYTFKDLNENSKPFLIEAIGDVRRDIIDRRWMIAWKFNKNIIKKED